MNSQDKIITTKSLSGSLFFVCITHNVLHIKVDCTAGFVINSVLQFCHSFRNVVVNSLTTTTAHVSALMAFPINGNIQFLSFSSKLCFS